MQLLKQHKNDFQQQIYGLQLIDRVKRAQSQSGGAFTALAESILEADGIVYGVCLNDMLEAEYCRVDNVEDLAKLKGSKYVQAKVGGIFHKVRADLRRNKKVLFSGTPCYVQGLIGFLSQAELDQLFTCDIICHGVVSPLIYAEYIQHLKRKTRSDITHFNFRDKKKGWHSTYETYVCKNGSKTTNQYASLFLSNICIRESCYHCKYATFDRISDITVGDFWGIEKTRPEIDDNTGISLMLINSEKGEALFTISKNKVQYFSTSKEKCVQPQLIGPTKDSPSRRQFWNDYHQKAFARILFKYAEGGIGGYVKKNVKVLLRKMKIYNILHKMLKSLKEK